MVVICKCGAPVPPEKHECQACGEPCGYPNVRAASAQEEREILERNLESARVSARARGCLDILERFGLAVLDSKAVIARDLGVVADIVLHNRNYTSYYQQLASGARVAEDNRFDRTRGQIDAAIFPNYNAEIRFASLTLNTTGLSGYGGCLMIMKEPLIARRSSVFLENPMTLLDRIHVPLNKPFPQGYRAAWEERNKLAMAKLHPEISSTTSDAEFPGILVSDKGGTANSDYIEVHIYGPVNLYTLEKVIAPRGKNKPDRVILRDMADKLQSVGAVLEET